MANTHIEVRKYQTDVLIIGGGTAGCYAAALLGEKTDLKVLIAEKAGILYKLWTVRTALPTEYPHSSRAAKNQPVCRGPEAEQGFEGPRG